MADEDELFAVEAPDQPSGRFASIQARLGLPPATFAGLLVPAYQHAQLPARASGATAWQPIGPRNLAGAVRILRQDPNNAQTFYAGTSGGGVWKTETDGYAWFRVGTQVTGPVAEITGPVHALAVSSQDSRVVIVGTGEQRRFFHQGLGLFMSVDGGRNFTQVVRPPSFSVNIPPGGGDHYANIAIDPGATATAGAGTATTAGATVNFQGGGVGTGFFVVGDVIDIAGQLRVVTAVAAANVTVDRAFDPAIGVATAYRRVTPRYWVAAETGLFRFDPGRGWTEEQVLPAPPGTIQALVASPTIIRGDANTRFRTTFRVNDLIKIGNQSTQVSVITNDRQLTVAPSLGAIAAGTAYHREIQCDDVRCATDPTNANQTLIIAGLHGLGVFRGVFNRTTRAIAWTQPRLLRTNGQPIQRGQVLRVRTSDIVAQGGQVHVYAVMENVNATTRLQHPTHVYRSVDGGQTFTRRARPYTAGGSANADYCLDIAMDPANPARVLVGALEVYFSANSGGAFRRVLDWTEYDGGTVRRNGPRQGDFEGADFTSPRAQHADVHTVLFDRRNGANVWVAHDGGICFTAALPAGQNPAANRPPRFSGWRTRSYGMQCAQFYDVTCSPFHQSITGGGLQDNGTALSYGGSTWYHIDGGDGMKLAFSNNPRRIYASWQSGYDRLTVAPAANGPQASFFATPLADVPDAVNSDADVHRVRARTINPGPNLVFHPLLEGHPTASDQILIGRTRRLRRSVNPQNNAPTLTNIAPQLPANHSPVSASFVPRAPSTEFWFGTNRGNVYRRHNNATTLNSPPWVNANAWVTDIDVVAASAAAPAGQARVVVVTGHGNAGPGEIWIADVRPGNPAVNWVSLRVGLSAANANLTPPPGPISSVRFEPNDPTRLYIGTLAGVYGCDQLPAFGAALPGPSFRWRTFNAGLPVGLVESLDITLSNTLRCATFGHGMFERALNATAATVIPAVKLVIRNHIADDARTYPAANRLADDPRLAPGTVPDGLHSPDIRVDAPRAARRAIFGFGEPLDAAEFEEVMRPESPIRGDRNVVHVHVQNRGHTAANQVQVHLYFAEATNNTTAPNLQANFRANFPNDPPAGDWQRAAPPTIIGQLAPGEPHVVRFDWMPPHGTGTHLALMAITSTAQDPANLTAVGMSDVVATLTAASRHVAVRIDAAVASPIYLRDGVEDQGVVGAVAWGGRSPDLVVLGAAPPANPRNDAALNNLLDPRRADRVRAGNNFVLVRVHNRSSAPVTADVQVFQVPRNRLAAPAQWVDLGTVQTPAIPANDWAFSAPITWNVAAPDPTTLLVAIARQRGAPVAPFPSHTEDVRDLRSLWRFLRSGISADRTAARALRRA